MGSDESPPRLREAAARVAASHGLELFDLQFRRESTGWVLRVILDRPWMPPAPAEPPDTARERSAGAPRERSADSGAPASERARGRRAKSPDVSIEDCQRVSEDLSALLDVEEETLGVPDVKYTLEVSSPGLDRPLRGEPDYVRFQGRLAKIVTTEPLGGQSSFAGRLGGLEQGQVLLVEGRRTHRVPVALIKRARLEVEF